MSIADRRAVATEQQNIASRGFHKLSVADCVDVILEEDKLVFRALQGAKPALTQFVESVLPRFQNGGRVIYVGAGSSGRLGAIDAAELGPTFQLPPGRVIALLAGGPDALHRAVEGAEDDPEGAINELDALDLESEDVLLGISAGGATPYVLGALHWAKKRCPSLYTGLLACHPPPETAAVDQLILLETGAEVLRGSTRMKAGSATKMALTAFSTTLMARCGYVYDNLMVRLHVSNQKLRDRAMRIVETVTGKSRSCCQELLEAVDWQVSRVVGEYRQKPQFFGDFLLIVDAGATWTRLKAFDKKGVALSLWKEGKKQFSVQAGPGNIVECGVHGMRCVLNRLFCDLEIGEQRLALQQVIGEAEVKVGCAGADHPKWRAAIHQLLLAHGFSPEKITVKGDVAMQLDALASPAILLCAGTGSVCVGKRGEKTFRAGGLGRVLGDEGSAYFIGREGLSRAIAAEQAWGPSTDLVQCLRDTFKIDMLSDLIEGVSSYKISKAQIASLCPSICSFAKSGDLVAQSIVMEALEALARLLRSVLDQMGEAPVYVSGGLLLGESAAERRAAIQCMLEPKYRVTMRELM